MATAVPVSTSPVGAPAGVPQHGAAPAAAGGQQQVVYYVYQMQAPANGASSGTGGQAMDWSVCFSFYFLRTALNFLNIAAWLIYLAGACKAQANCNMGYFDSAAPAGYPTPGPGWGAAPYNLTSGDCGTIFGLTWWSVWLQFAAVVVATLTSISMFTRSKTVRSIFTTTMYFFIMSSVLMFFIANEYVVQSWILNRRIDNNSNSWTQWVTATSLLAVGSITSLICNFLWICWNSYGDIPTHAGSPPVPSHGHGHGHGHTPVDGDAFVGPADHKHHLPGTHAGPTAHVPGSTHAHTAPHIPGTHPHTHTAPHIPGTHPHTTSAQPTVTVAQA